MIEIQTGYCAFCGDPQIVHMSGSQHDADMMATAKCDCDEAMRARMIVQARQSVDDVVGGAAERDGYGEVHPDVVQLIEETAWAVAEGRIAGAQMTIGDGSRVTIRIGKGGLEVKRERKKLRMGGEKALNDRGMAEALSEIVSKQRDSDIDAI